MFRSMPSILALTSLAACGGGLSDEELATVFTAESAVSADVAAEVLTEATAGGQGKHIDVDGDLSGFSVSGDIEGRGVIWSGTIGVEGEGSYTATEYDFDLSLSYDAVEAVGHDATLDGDLDQSWSFSSEGGKYHTEYDLVGDLDVSGGVKGHAEIDFSMIVDISGSEYSYTYEGTINGKDVADMSGSGSGDLM